MEFYKTVVGVMHYKVNYFIKYFWPYIEVNFTTVDDSTYDGLWAEAHILEAKLIVGMRKCNIVENNNGQCTFSCLFKKCISELMYFKKV